MRTIIALVMATFPFVAGWAYELFALDRLSLVGLFSAEAATVVPIRRIVALGLATLVGILSSLAVTPDLHPAAAGLLARARSGLASNKTLLALAAAPMVFYGVYASSDQQPDTVAAVLLAYQNGFFWESVLSRLSQAREPSAQAGRT